MKRGSTLFLRGVVVFIGLVVIALCVIIALPSVIRSEYADFYRPILYGMLVPAVPFFVALFETLKLLGYIDQSKAFSELSIRTLKNIKYCAITISAMYTAGMPYIYHVANRNHAPGIAIIGSVIILASFVVATFAAVLQKLLQDALDIKSENDLMV